LGENDRWVEVAPPGGGAAVVLVPSHGQYPTGRITGIALESPDAQADHEEMWRYGVDVDAALVGGDGRAPLMYFFGDNNENQRMIGEAQ
jgi:hypothetical protein